jgi:hypothetical protein
MRSRWSTRAGATTSTNTFAIATVATITTVATVATITAANYTVLMNIVIIIRTRRK